jgi:hypothetical protein
MPYPVSDFTATPVTGSSPLTVQFTDLSIIQVLPDFIIAWKWDFGDGGTSVEQNPKHTYNYPGTYTVSLETFTNSINNGAGSYVGISYDDVPISHNKKIKTDYITVADPSGRVTESTCLRFATEPTEGQGWSECNGDDWVDPVDNGAYIVHDDNSVPRCIIEDEDGEVYELDTYDRVNAQKPCFADKAAYGGTGGTEISGAKWEKERTAGPGNEDKHLYDEKSWLQVRPNDPDNRSQTGYTASGMRSAQEFGLQVYMDGEKNVAIAETDDVPEDGDLVFPGVRVEGHRLQYVTTFAASEFMLVETKHKILVKDRTETIDKITMNEYTLQLEMETNKVLHITRGNLLYDRVSKLSAVSAGTLVQTGGPDGWAKSGIGGGNSGGANIQCPNQAIVGPYTILMFMNSHHTVPTILEAGTGLPIAMTAYAPPAGLAVVNWSLRYHKGVNLSAGRWILDTYMTPPYYYEIFDVRIYSKQLTDAAIANYYRNVSQNKGDAYLPFYVE